MQKRYTSITYRFESSSVRGAERSSLCLSLFFFRKHSSGQSRINENAKIDYNIENGEKRARVQLSSLSPCFFSEVDFGKA